MKITDNITESLLLTTEEGLEPVLLTGMPEISEDQLVYSFELLPDVKFHNGEILKSSDVKYSYERLIKLDRMASLLANVVGYDEMIAGTADELSGFIIIDDTHFTITLKMPYAPFLSVLSTSYCAIYPEAACEAAGDDWGFTVLYGTGPFKMDTYGLMNCIPKLDGDDKEDLSVIKGTVPSFDDMPKGCAFCPRCQEAMAICHEHMPILADFEGRKVRCFKYTDKWEDGDE